MNVSRRPRSSVFQLGFFMSITRDPSSRKTSLAFTNVKVSPAPMTVRTINPMYVPSVTGLLVVVCMFWPSGIKQPITAPILKIIQNQPRDMLAIGVLFL